MRPGVSERPPDGSAGPAALAGLAGSAAAMVAAALAHTLAPSVPFPPLAIAQAVVRAAPGGLATSLIDVLGHWALRLAVLGTLLAFLASGPVLGLLIPTLARRIPWGRWAAPLVAFVPLWAAIMVVSPSDPQFVGRGLLALAELPVLAAAGGTAAIVFRRLRSSRAPGSVRANEGPAAGVSRRVVLRSLWWGAAGALLGVANLGRLLRPSPNPGRLMLHLSNVTPAAVPTSTPTDQRFDQIPGLTPEVTSNTDFYVVDEEIIDPDIDPRSWTLAVGGLVSRPLRIPYDELLRFPAVERFQTLECISNKVGGDLISTSKWAGVPLPLILERAGVDQKRAVEVVFRAAGGYSDSLPIAQAMDESTLIAVGMNDHVLPRQHGFPARLLSVGTYGMKNPKWLTGITVVDTPYVGYWELRGWSKRAAVKTGSRIDRPFGSQAIGGPFTIAGLAFAGDRGVSRVEVSTDGGGTWAEAELKRPLSPFTWRLWKYRWAPPRGPKGERILVRAVDGRGAVQPAVETEPHPSGASGYDGVTVRNETGAG